MDKDHTKNIIEIKNVSFSYGDAPILKNIDLDIHKGDYLGVVGPNGGGKTTLIKLILGLLKSESGTINVFSKRIAYLGQKAVNFDQKFPATVWDVVSMGRFSTRGVLRGLNREDKDIVADALEKVGMSEYKNKLVGDLSGGQQQRTLIAKALAQKPEIIFLDEPTSGVDQESQKNFYRILKDLNQKFAITLVLISHDVDIITKEVTEIVAINQKIVFYGQVKDFIREEKGIKYISDKMGQHDHAFHHHD